jgi:putative DNA primase/helicase
MDTEHSTYTRLQRQIENLEKTADSTTQMLGGDHLPGLLSHHLRQLRESGLNDDTIKVNGIYSETNALKIRSLIGLSENITKKMGAVLVFPFCNTNGDKVYNRIKPDIPRRDRNKKPIKYESPVGEPNQVYLPAGVREKCDNHNCELLITEGEKKSLKATQEGFSTIGLVGVHGWKAKSEAKLLPTLQYIEWSGRRVYIVFDSDINEKPAVQNAESWLAHHLKNCGAKVKVARLPDGPPDANGKPTKMGLDDFLIAHGPGELRKLLDDAQDPAEIVGPIVQQKADTADPASEAECFLEQAKLNGVLRLRYWAGSFWWYSQGKYTERPTSEVLAYLTRHLNKNYIYVKTSHTSNLLAQVKALSLLSSTYQPPCWIDSAGDAFNGWKPEEIVIAKNGIVHLPTLTTGKPDYLASATPALFATSALDYDFSLEAPEPIRWRAFLTELWPNDPESIATLQEWFGYLLTPDTRLQKMLLLIGPQRSGKGTIGRILKGVIGEGNVCGPTLASLVTNFGLWPFLGKTAAIISDARLSGRADQAVITERLLSISGEDAQTIDRKNLEPVTTKLLTRFTIISNELPRLNDSSGALAGRFIVLRLTESFYGREDTALTDALLQERSGILLWAIQGWQRLWERGRFVQPESGGDLREAMDDLSSPVLAFIKDCCIVDDRCSIRTDSMYSAWRQWCETAGREPTAENTFGRDLLAAVPRLKRVQPREGEHRYRAYQGIGLRTSS